MSLALYSQTPYAMGWRRFVLRCVRAGTILRAVGLVGGGALPADEPSAPTFAVAYAPAAVYRDAEAVFTTEGRAGVELDVLWNGEILSRGLTAGPRTPFAFTPRRPGVLTFRDGTERQLSFALISPQTEAALTVRDGFLAADGMPAILLAEHRHPPKMDRRWQTVSALAGLFRDPRPCVESVVWMTTRAAARDDMPDAEPGIDTNRCRRLVVPVDHSEILALIAQVDRLPTAQAVAVRLSDFDLERGAGWIEYRMKLEWLLQRLRQRGFLWIFLFGPVMEPERAQVFADWRDEVKTAAAGNEAFVYFPEPARSGPTAPPPVAWPAVEKAMREHIRF